MGRFLFFLVALLALVGQANAQRCLPKMRGIQLTTGMADGLYYHANQDETGYYFGAALSTYTIGGNKWYSAGSISKSIIRIKIPVFQRRNLQPKEDITSMSFLMPTKSSSFLLAVRLLLELSLELSLNIINSQTITNKAIKLFFV